MNSVIENIKIRRSTRNFRQDMLPADILHEILEAGQYAPSGGNSQSSHMYVILGQTVLHELTRHVERAFSSMQISEGMYKSIQNSIMASQRGGYDFMYHAPVLVIVTNKKGYGNAMADSACLLENMMLAAASLHIGSCWINQLHWLDEDLIIRDYLSHFGVSKDETICGSLALGYAESENKRPLDRTGNQITYIRD